MTYLRLFFSTVKQGYTACIAFLYNLRFNQKPHFVNINYRKTYKAEASVLECISMTGYAMKGAGFCMSFVLLIGLTSEMLPDT